MRILAIAANPGTGKSTLMLNIIEALGGIESVERYGLCDYLRAGAGKVVVLGKYEPGVLFSGTDRLSMGVQSDAEAFLCDLDRDGQNAPAVALEGDRLCAPAFLRFAKRLGEVRLIILEADQHIVDERRIARGVEAGKQQNPTWLKGRYSKVQNLKMNFFGEARKVNTMEESLELASELKDWLLGLTEAPKSKSTLLF